MWNLNIHHISGCHKRFHVLDACIHISITFFVKVEFYVVPFRHQNICVHKTSSNKCISCFPLPIIYPAHCTFCYLITKKMCRAPITWWCCAVSQKKGHLSCTIAKSNIFTGSLSDTWSPA